MKRSHKKDRQVIALERIDKLFAQAKESNDLSLSNRYVTLARKLSTKYKVPIKREYKASFCKVCGSFFVYGKNCIVRKKPSHIVYRCLECKNIRRLKP
jgi:ribonuclease P protein subunit RPR2